MANPFGNLVRSPKSGKSIGETWAIFFLNNEIGYRRKETILVFTDRELTQAMLRLFPERKGVALFSQVRRVRACYNRGALAGQKGKPRFKSWEYVRGESGRLERR